LVSKNLVAVTVGICTRNSEKTILRAIRSIAEQDFPRELIEVIVVDGNSQDQTLSIIREHLPTTSIKTSFYSENTGLGFARQIVVNKASAPYIVWVDGDVELSPSYLKEQVAFMGSNPSIAVALGNAGILVDDNLVATLENIGYVIDGIRHKGKSTTQLMGAGGAIFRTAAIKQAGGFNTEIKGAHEDMDIGYRLREAGWKFCITSAVFYHRQRTTWKSLWKQHYWYGYGLHFFQSVHKDHNLFSDKAVDRVIFSSLAYKLTHRKAVFLLPLHFVFKKIALLFGYLSAHMDSYGD
jgi:glycosyltransferase involved in cell wall biosynthesis